MNTSVDRPKPAPAVSTRPPEEYVDICGTTLSRHPENKKLSLDPTTRYRRIEACLREARSLCDGRDRSVHWLMTKALGQIIAANRSQSSHSAAVERQSSLPDCEPPRLSR